MKIDLFQPKLQSALDFLGVFIGGKVICDGEFNLNKINILRNCKVIQRKYLDVRCQKRRDYSPVVGVSLISKKDIYYLFLCMATSTQPYQGAATGSILQGEIVAKNSYDN